MSAIGDMSVTEEMNVTGEVKARDLRPAVGDPVYPLRTTGKSRRRVKTVDEVVNRVGFPCRWFVYDQTGNGFPVEPLSGGGWVAVEAES